MNELIQQILIIALSLRSQTAEAVFLRRYYNEDDVFFLAEISNLLDFTQ